MKCPFCKRELVRGEDRRYETLCDHVDNPNRNEYPLRPTYVCECDEANGLYWDQEGGTYITDHSVEFINHYYDLKKQHGGCLDALDSVWSSIR